MHEMLGTSSGFGWGFAALGDPWLAGFGWGFAALGASELLPARMLGRDPGQGQTAVRVEDDFGAGMCSNSACV